MLRELVIETASLGPGDAYSKVDVAADVNGLTGTAGAIALRLPWDAVEDYRHLRDRVHERGLRVGSIAHELTDPDVAGIDVAAELGATAQSVRLDDGACRRRILDALARVHAELPAEQELLVSHADWGSALLACQELGRRAKVDVDQGERAEQVVRLLAEEGRLGGVRFDDTRYAPFETFLIFVELAERLPRLMLFSHDIEATVVAVVDLQEAFAKARLVDRSALREAREFGDALGARQVLLDAFRTDVRPACAAAREALGAAEDPLMALRQRELIR
jgi:L-rhamnose isomerase/sugar isomerase